jgi:hypothetical protein
MSPASWTPKPMEIGSAIKKKWPGASTPGWDERDRRRPVRARLTEGKDRPEENGK